VQVRSLNSKREYINVAERARLCLNPPFMADFP